MKKIFTLMATALAAVSMQAADFQLYYEDKPAVDGATYTRGYTLYYEEEWEGVMYYTWEQNSELFLVGTPGTEVTVYVEELDANMQICFPDQCAGITPESSKADRTRIGKLTSNKVDLQLHGYPVDTEDDQDPGALMKEINLTVSAWANSDPSAKTTVKIKILPKPNSEVEAGIGSATAETNFVKPAAGNIINYNVSKPATLALYSITGRLVARYEIANSGSVNASALPKGIYIYTDGKHKGKFVVR